MYSMTSISFCVQAAAAALPVELQAMNGDAHLGVAGGIPQPEAVEAATNGDVDMEVEGPAGVDMDVEREMQPCPPVFRFPVSLPYLNAVNKLLHAQHATCTPGTVHCLKDLMFYTERLSKLAGPAVCSATLAFVECLQIALYNLHYRQRCK